MTITSWSSATSFNSQKLNKFRRRGAWWEPTLQIMIVQAQTESSKIIHY